MKWNLRKFIQLSIFNTSAFNAFRTYVSIWYINTSSAVSRNTFLSVISVVGENVEIKTDEPNHLVDSRL